MPANRNKRNAKQTGKPAVCGLVRRMVRQSIRPGLEADSLPTVSVVTPTWNRAEFLAYLIYMFQYQDYPADRRELVILDDSEKSHAALVEQMAAGSPERGKIRYYHTAERMTIGQKRNRLNELAHGEYIVCMDDDDYHPPDRISHVIGEMRRTGCHFSGSDQVFVWYSHIDRIYRTHPFGSNHALNGTFAYHRNYLRNHRYDDKATFAEEGSFMNGYTVPLVQIDPKRSMLCIAHGVNTYDKDFIMASCEWSGLSLDEFVHDRHLLNHFRRLHRAPLSARVQWQAFDRIVVRGCAARPGQWMAFLSRLAALGADERRIVEDRDATENGWTTAEHLEVARRARREGWRNYLVLDERVRFVEQERAVKQVNRFLASLDHVSWEIALLGADVRSGYPLTSLPGVQVVKQATEAVAYAVNGTYFDAWIDFLERCAGHNGMMSEHAARVDHAWLLPMKKSQWLAMYPSFAYLPCREDGKDLTAGFFRKAHGNPGEASRPGASVTKVTKVSKIIEGEKE